MSKKVLIIEDSWDISESLKLLIQMEGYEVIVANNGTEGCEKAQNEKPDLILVDLSLPDLSGIEVTREIRSFPETSETPIVCVSSYAESRKDEVLAAGCNEVLTKTSFMNSFAPTLKRYLEDSGSN